MREGTMNLVRKSMFAACIFTAFFVLSAQTSFAAEACSMQDLHEVYWYFDEQPLGYAISDYIHLTGRTGWATIQRTISTFQKTLTCEYDPDTQSDRISSVPGFMHFYLKGRKEVVLFVRADDLSISKIWVRLKEPEEDQ
jgi:hypothetical protein